MTGQSLGKSANGEEWISDLMGHGIQGIVERLLPVKGRGARRRPYLRLEPRSFDIVVIDPPRWAKGPFGAIDVVRDYPALFKPAVRATAPGGHVLATNHAPSVSVDAWIDILDRCAHKAGRSLASLEIVTPDADFPSFDGQPPLKMAWATVA